MDKLIISRLPCGIIEWMSTEGNHLTHCIFTSIWNSTQYSAIIYPLLLGKLLLLSAKSQHPHWRSRIIPSSPRWLFYWLPSIRVLWSLSKPSMSLTTCQLSSSILLCTPWEDPNYSPASPHWLKVLKLGLIWGKLSQFTSFALGARIFFF